jgi:ammonia channel protein AmtB
MRQQPIRYGVTLLSLVFGLATAILFGFGVGGSASLGPGGNVTIMQPGFSPKLSLIGFVIGSAVGAVVGSLWRLPRYGKRIAVILLTMFGGIFGLLAAAVFAAPTTIVVSGNSLTYTHGRFGVVELVVALLGIAITVLTIWRSDYSMRHRKAIAAIVLTVFGGIVGSLAAAFFGAQTTITSSGNSMLYKHGATAEVVVVGALLGIMVTMLTIWKSGYSMRRLYVGDGPTAG